MSGLPRGIEISSWTFFNSPFCADLKNIQFYIIWWNLDWDIVKILEGGHLKSQHFSLIVESFTLALMSNNEPLWQFMTNYEYLLALIVTQERSRIWSHGTVTTIESSWVLVALWPQDHACQWALMRAHESLIVPMSAHFYSWMLMAPWSHAYECSWLIMTIHTHSWVFMNIHEYSWAFMGTYKRPWALIIMEP